MVENLNHKIEDEDYSPEEAEARFQTGAAIGT